MFSSLISKWRNNEMTKSAPERLKEATIEMIVSRGYGNATLIPILERGGLSKGALFHHFKSRDDLTAAAYLDLLDTIINEMEGLAAELKSGGIQTSVFLSKVASLFASDTMIATMEIAIALRVSPNLAELVELKLEKWHKFLDLYWIELFDIPGMPLEIQRTHWLMVMNIFRGIGVQYTFNRNIQNIESVIERIHTTCFENVRIRES